MKITKRASPMKTLLAQFFFSIANWPKTSLIPAHTSFSVPKNGFLRNFYIMILAVAMQIRINKAHSQSCQLINLFYVFVLLPKHEHNLFISLVMVNTFLSHCRCGRCNNCMVTTRQQSSII